MIRTIRALGLLLVAISCSSDTVLGPPAVASITITSPIGTRLATGRTVQLVAEARDGGGNVLTGVNVTWTSSNGSLAQVSTSGVVSGTAAGGVTITASASGVSAAFGVSVIAADLDAITPTLDDAFATLLVSNLTQPLRGRVEAVLTQCDTGATAGNFTTLEACLAAGRAEVAAATATDRVLLELLARYFDHVQRLMNL